MRLRTDDSGGEEVTKFYMDTDVTNGEFAKHFEGKAGHFVLPNDWLISAYNEHTYEKSEDWEYRKLSI